MELDNEDTNVNIREMLELQVSEIEMLTSMFPTPGEFCLDDKLAIVNIRSYLQGQMKYEYLHSRLGFTVSIPGSSEAKVELVCNFPHEYPAVPPVVFTRATKMNREGHRKLNEDLLDFIHSIDRGELCMYLVIDWIQENLDKYQHTTEEQTSKQVEEDTVFTRLWIYSHHIYSKFKRKDIIDWAGELKLTGFSMPGKPGVVCVEGYSRSVDEYWHRLRRLNWKKLTIREKDDCDIGEEDIAKYRKFGDFEEKVFDARAGKGREYHMDLGKFYKFLENHGFGHVFQTYFGVDGKQSAGVSTL